MSTSEQNRISESFKVDPIQEALERFRGADMSQCPGSFDRAFLEDIRESLRNDIRLRMTRSGTSVLGRE